MRENYIVWRDILIIAFFFRASNFEMSEFSKDFL